MIFVILVKFMMICYFFFDFYCVIFAEKDK